MRKKAMSEQAPASWVVKIPPPVWMLAMLVVAYLLRLWTPLHAIVVHVDPAGYMFGGFGAALGVWAVLIFAIAGTEVEPASHSNKLLITRSPYNFTRNPMYLGLILIGIGFALYWGSLSFYLVPVALFVLIDRVFIPFEEEKMQRQFGDQYTEYRARVRRWL